MTFLGYAVAITLAAVAGVGAQGADATGATCASVGVTVTPLHGTRFYVDSSSSPVLDSGYTGVSLSPSAARSNVWVRLSGFTGGALGLNTNQPAAIPLGNLTAASTSPAYFFLTASPVAQTSTAQNFSVDIYQGDPSRGGSLLCSYADGYSSGVYDTIQASANKVQDVTGDSVAATVSTSSPVMGGTVTLTVEGTTGTLGNGPDGTPFIYETPTSLGTWPAGAFRLVGTTLTLSPGASQTVYTNQLQVSSASFSSAQDYIAQYTFKITGSTSSTTATYPIQEISSGTQVKHTNTSSLASIPPIQPASNPLTLSDAASAASLPSAGGTVTYTLKLHSTSSTSTSVDEIVDTLPANATYQAGTAKLDGSATADPSVSSGTLVFPGPFTLTSAADRTLTFDVSLPGVAGTYTNSAVGYVSPTQIDTTVTTSDSAPATASTTVAGVAQTISFAQPADTRVDQGPVALTGTATSGLAVSFASSTPSVCTVSGASATLVAAGTCTITASQAGNGTYAAATPVTQSFTVTAAPLSQTISFPQPADTRVDQGPVSLNASASSGLGVGYASSTLSVCAVSGSSVTLVAVGTCTITASQAGNGTYATATPVTQSFTVTAAPLSQTISFPQPADTRVDQGPVSLNASASSGLGVGYASSTLSVCTVSGASATLVAAGTCTITASQAGNGTYAAATPVARSFAVTVAPVAQTITFPQPADTRVDQGPVSLNASTSSGLGVGYASSTLSVCAVSGSSVTLVAVGTCTITASQTGNGTYAAATPVAWSFAVTVAPVAQTITFVQPADIRIDNGPVALTASASSGLAVSFASSTASVCTVSGSTVTLVAVGTCTITASQAGNGTYAAATPVTRSFQVTAAPTPQTISFLQPADTGVDQGPVPLTATATSGLTVTFSSSTPSVCTVTGVSVTLVAVGTCTITASQAGDATYSAATPVTQSFSVPSAPASPTTQTITFAQPADTRVDQGPVSLSASASSGLAVSFVSSTPSVCTVSGSTVTLVAVGTCTITVSQAGNATYSAAPDVTRSFAVTSVPASPTAQAITFAQPADTRVDQGPVSLVASASSGLTVSFASSTPSVCTVSGSTVTLVAVGTCTITVSQAGNATYSAAPDVTRSFAVTAAPTPGTPTISFPQPADTAVDEGPVSLPAGGSVTYTSATPAVCTVSGSTVTLVSTGTCTITASEPGAADVTRSFEVTLVTPPLASPPSQPAPAPAPAPAPQAIVFAPVSPVVGGGDGTIDLSASATSGLTPGYASATPEICSISATGLVTILGNGTCTVVATQSGNDHWSAAPPVSASFVVTLPPLPAPTTNPVSTTAGKTTKSVVGGIPEGATVAIDGTPTLKGVAALHVVGTHVVVTPTQSFSGIVYVPVIVSMDGRTAEATVAVVVRPKAPTHIAVTPQSSTSTRITWKPSGGAIGYVVSIDGRIACRTAATVCRVPALVTPNEHVTVVSTGNARTVSDVARGRYANKPVLIAIVHFATGSSQLDAMAHGLLDATESKIAKGGFTHAMLTCHTDSAGSFVYNMALSGTRCGSVATYVKQRLGITHVTYRQAAYAFLRPAAPNSTRQGMAKNRRVEVWAK